jgi:hypothetical protein
MKTIFSCRAAEDAEKKKIKNQASGFRLPVPDS